jgi:hypothetical protein
MRKNFSLILLGENGSSLKEISFNQGQLLFAGLFLMTFVLFITILFFKIAILKEISPDTQKLETALSQQSHKLDIQRKKIINFNNDIKILRKDLQKLNRYEKEVKIIAGIEKTDDPSRNLVGIGGPQSRDHNSRLRGRVNPPVKVPKSREQLPPVMKSDRGKN